MAYLDILNPEHPAYYVNYIAGKIAPRDGRTISDIPLADKKEAFLDYVSKNYRQPTVVNYRWCINRIINEGRRGFYTYNQLLAKYPQRHIHTYIIQILVYDFFDILPSAGKLNFHGYYYRLSQQNQALVEGIMYCLKAEKLRPSTINIDAYAVAKFLCFAEESGVSDIHHLKESVIREYSILQMEPNEVVHRIGRTLRRYAELSSDTELQKIAAWFPRSRKCKKIYTPLLNTERDKLEQYLTDLASPLSKRDRAIGILFFYTGIRSVDVRNLKPGDIDLENKQIHFVQRKTGVHVRIPMRPVVSNAIVDYVKNERSRKGYPYLFVPDRVIKNHRPGAKPYPCNVKYVVNKIYDAIGIRTNGERRGTHILRHAVSDRMLNEGTDISVISRILGHTDPTTTFNYINANIDQLRACALPIDDYPIKSKLYEKNNG